MDDDVVMPSGTLTRMLEFIGENPDYGWLSPYCKNAGTARTALAGRPHYSPGGVFRQDKLVRNILLEYYDSTVDVLDKQRSNSKVWEIAFLTDLFPLLDRSITVQDDNVIYHLDYHERPNWDLRAGKPGQQQPQESSRANREVRSCNEHMTSRHFTTLAFSGRYIWGKHPG